MSSKWELKESLLSCPETSAGAGDILLNTSTLLSCAAQIIHAHFSDFTLLAKCDHIAHGFGKNAQTQCDYLLIKFPVKLHKLKVQMILTAMTLTLGLIYAEKQSVFL